MAPIKQNPNSILFLYEGETEEEFYKKIFDLKLGGRMIKRNFGNLNGVYSLNDKVKSKIKSYLSNPSFKNCNQIHVFVAFDREGERHMSSQLKLDDLKKELIFNKSRIAGIYEIVATQDLEAWFFHDLNGIYNYLRVPINSRNMSAFINIEKQNNRILSDLFHRYKKHYQKGRRVKGFMENLDLEKVYNKVDELKDAFEAMLML